MTGKLLAGKSRKLLPGLCSMLGTLLILAVIAAFLPLTVPQLLGYEVYEVISGSMEPEIPVGSVIYVKAAEPEMISENHQSDGEFITKGDANSQEDMTPVPYGDLFGRVKLHIPVLGTVMAILAGGTGKIYAALLAVWGVMHHRLAGILKASGERKNER